MSAPNPSDPRMLLPEWLRDDSPSVGDRPVIESPTPQPVSTATETIAIETVIVDESTVKSIASPYSDRLPLDTRLDPDLLVRIDDLPKWLGGLEHAPTIATITTPPPPTLAKPTIAIEPPKEPEPYLGADAPEDGVVDVQIDGWILIAAAALLLVLLVGAWRLYLS